MKNNLLQVLLRRFFSARISPAEYTVLKSEVQKATDEAMDSALDILWKEQNLQIPVMDDAVKFRVLNNIQNQITDNKPSHNFSWTRIAATILIPLLVSAASFYYFSGKFNRQEDVFTVFAERGQKTQIFLPDGTQVWLNSDSYLSYSSVFNRDNREVTLKGEAFFDVTKDDEHSFTVKAEGINIVVHGTAFNVSVYPDEEMATVSLLRGAVTVENAVERVQLEPGQQVQIPRDRQSWKLFPCDVEMECLWTQNMLRFENTPAVEVFAKLEKWYGVNIHVENSDSSVKYGFVLKSESLREILDLINRITAIDYQINGEEVNIRYK